MRLGIMQPYFFPYIGYFALIKNTDRFVFFDTPQYISHGWVNRNRILKHSGGTKYIVVPIKKCVQQTPINQVMIDDSQDWKASMKGSLTVYKKKAPYYTEVMNLLEEILEKPYQHLSDLNIASTKAVCSYLGLEKEFDVFSEMDMDISDQVKAPDEWALYITQYLKYDTYVNPPGGISFFDRKKYETQGINLEFLKVHLTPYIQKIGYFEEGLSIVDVMMFNNPEQIMDMMQNYEIL